MTNDDLFEAAVVEWCKRCAGHVLTSLGKDGLRAAVAPYEVRIVEVERERDDLRAKLAALVEATAPFHEEQRQAFRTGRTQALWDAFNAARAALGGNDDR